MPGEFEFIETLGEGAFGKVYLVSSKNGGGQVNRTENNFEMSVKSAFVLIYFEQRYQQHQQSCD